MKRIFVKKVFSYDPTFQGKLSKFSGYCEITMQTLDPGIDSSQKEVDSLLVNQISGPVFCSSLQRGKESAESWLKIRRDVQQHSLDELREVRFKLNGLVTEQEFMEFGSTLVRQRFIETFIADGLVESRIDIVNRINIVMEKLSHLSEGDYLVISHSFFMKLWQVYILDNRLFDEPSILARHFDYRMKTFDYGGGFELYLP